MVPRPGPWCLLRGMMSLHDQVRGPQFIMLHEYEFLIRMAAAIFLGGAIGYERELREQPAGLRTHLLVALGSATFMLVSSQFVFFQHYPGDGIVRVDGSRIASNVVVGIGFLGGGAILHSGLRIKGLTTAASLWLVAAVGLAAGAGMYLVAMSATVLTLFALVVLRYMVEEPRKHQIDLVCASTCRANSSAGPRWSSSWSLWGPRCRERTTAATSRPTAPS